MARIRIIMAEAEGTDEQVRDVLGAFLEGLDEAQASSSGAAGGSLAPAGTGTSATDIAPLRPLLCERCGKLGASDTATGTFCEDCKPPYRRGQ